MKKIVINENEVQNYISDMKTCLNEFTLVLDNMNKMKNDLVWKSKVEKQALNLYDNMIKENLAFSNNMSKFINYLNDYMNRYFHEGVANESSD